MLGKWSYVLQMGNEERLAYSTRFPSPIFYLIEMTQPYPHIHPIYFPIYFIALLGLALWLWRRHEEDNLLGYNIDAVIWKYLTFSGETEPQIFCVFIHHIQTKHHFPLEFE